MTLYVKLLGLGLLLSFMRCSSPEFQPSQVKAPELIGDSFVIKTLSSQLNDNHNHTNHVGIRIDSLDKEFLLQGSLIVQPKVSMFNNLKSRIVAFKLVDDDLYMLEATQGHKVGDVLSQALVLAKFPIVEKRDKVILFDFAEGMSHIFVESDWHAQDLEGSYYNPDSWDSAAIDLSYLESAEIDEHNNLVIRQIAQMRRDVLGVQRKTPVEIKYYLTPYEPNSTFTPTVSENFDKMGFFEIAPQLEEGGQTVVYASKFDHKKGITFALSENTPEDYRQAVREGILYWNKAFGYDVINVIDAPKGVTAPDFNYNVVQWVELDNAGFAYADAQMDPRTGEILHAQVFLTSVFAFSSRKRAKHLLERMLNEVEHHTNHKHQQEHRISLRGFEKETLCDFHPQESMIAGLTSLISSEDNPSDDILLKVSQDYVREVVAHEIGHTLGLRHNFAGSLAANFPQSAKEGLFRDYLMKGAAPLGVITSSSVMEYQLFEEAVLTGDQLVSSSTALEYDNIAIKSLYDHIAFERASIPLFCTDSHVSLFADCARFESGASVFEYNLWKENKLKKDLPYILLERFLTAKELLRKGKINSIGEAILSPMKFALSDLSGRKKILKSLEGGAFLQVKRLFPYLNELNRSEFFSLESQYITESINKFGGLKNILSLVDVRGIDKYRVIFEQLLDKHNLDHEKVPFDDADLAIIKKVVNKFFASLPSAYMLADLQILEAAKLPYSPYMARELANVMTMRTAMWVLLTSGKMACEEVNDEGLVVTRHLPVFGPRDSRVRAANLLKPKGGDLLWGLREKQKVRKMLLETLNTAIGKNITEVDARDYFDDNFADWILDNQAVLRALL